MFVMPDTQFLSEAKRNTISAMKCTAVLLLLACVAFAQDATPYKDQKQILTNPRVTVSAVEIPAHSAIAASRPGRDLLTVITGDGGKSSFARGRVFFTPANTDERNRYEGNVDLGAVVVAFASPQGAVERKNPAPSRYCNPGSKTACVSERYLLCTAKSCVEEVTMGAGAVTTKHSHDTDHMIIAVTDYSLADDVVGKGVVMREVKSGNVEYIPAGIEHTLTNKSGREVRFVVVVFR